MDLTPDSNPPLTGVKWFHRKFDFNAISTSQPPSNSWVEITHRLRESSPTEFARLKIPRVSVEHMGSYKLLGINPVGSADFEFFLNVTREYQFFDLLPCFEGTATDTNQRYRVINNPERSMNKTGD